MANKAFGLIKAINKPGATIDFQFEYCVLASGGTIVVQDANVYVPIAYSDTPYSIWDKIVTQVRTDQSDSSLIVIPAPSSMEYLMYGRTY